jgi:hypothetical protein
MGGKRMDVRLLGSNVPAAHPWLRIFRHLSSSSRNKSSASLAASTGSRPKAERSASFSQKDAAGSDSTCSISIRSDIDRQGNTPRISDVAVLLTTAAGWSKWE